MKIRVGKPKKQEPIRILIVEDEFITLETLKTVLSEMKFKISGDAMTAKEAITVLERGETDLAILDINIKGDKDGIWLAKQIKDRYQIPFIFLTAYGDDSTIKRAIETEPYGFLVKPLNKVDVFTSIEVARMNFAKQSSDITKRENPLIVSKDSIFIQDEYMFTKLKIYDILFVKSNNDYLEIYLPGKKHLVRGKLTDFVKKLSTNFIQVHQSYVINTEAVEKFDADFILINDVEIPVGSNYKDELQGHLNLH
jgi:two-component system, LytTR family, response regulator